MNGNELVLSGKKIGFIGKGGAGKSTAMALLAHTMRKRGYDVCVLDADSTNEGLHLALGIDKPPRALIDHFGGMVFRGGKVTCPVDDPSVLLQAQVDLERLPREFVAENEAGVILLVAGKLAELGVGAGCDGPRIKIARDLVVRRGGRLMTMLVDLKAGIEDASRGVIVGMDDVIVICDPSAAGLGVAGAVKRIADQLRSGEEPATAHLEPAGLAELARRLFRESRLRGVEVILNRVPDDRTAEYMSRVLGSSGIEPLLVLPESPEIHNAWLHGKPLPGDGLSHLMTQALEGLESRTAAMGVGAP
jgi:CO dehydrogenase maturation factor